MYYIIEETLTKCTKSEVINKNHQYVICLTSEEWMQQKDSFDIGIEFDPNLSDIYVTQAELNYDSITGTFCIPDKTNFSKKYKMFAFALDEKGIVFIDDSGNAEKLVKAIAKTKRWRFPSLARFMYDFLSQFIQNDLSLIKKYERELDRMENAIENGSPEEEFSKRANEIRSDIRDLIDHYEELYDFGPLLEENENGFFKPDNTRYFRLFLDKLDSLRDASKSIRDLTIQIRDLYKTHLDIKQNHIMTVLTVITSIFMPLTLIVGWYGMNFQYMPELASPIAYPIVMAVCILIVILSLLYFKKKKWL